MHNNRLLYTLPEYQKKLRGSYHKLGLFLEKIDDHKIFIFRPVPNCPWLPESRKKYFHKLRKRLETLPRDRKYTFATLTYSTRLYSPVDVCNRIKHDINLFFKRMGYHHRKVQFFYVIELTDKYMPHIHIVFDQYIPWKKIRASWFHTTGNIVTDIRQKSRDSAFYHCLKYLTNMKKQSEAKWSFMFSHIDRIWTCSQGFVVAAKSGNNKYKFIFSVWDPDGYLFPGFDNPEKDLISNEVSRSDAIMIAGFNEDIKGIKVMNQIPDWVFLSADPVGPQNSKDLKLSPESFEIMFNFYDKKNNIS
ncbi:hypothetical protein ES703_73200 [subsurface metagenome]